MDIFIMKIYNYKLMDCIIIIKIKYQLLLIKYNNKKKLI